MLTYDCICGMEEYSSTQLLLSNLKVQTSMQLQSSLKVDMLLLLVCSQYSVSLTSIFSNLTSVNKKVSALIIILGIMLLMHSERATEEMNVCAKK